MAMINFELSGEHLEGALHRLKTVVLTVTGMLVVAMATLFLLSSTFLGPGQVPANGILDLY